MSKFSTSIMLKSVFWRLCLVLCLMLLWMSTTSAQSSTETENKRNIAAFIDAAYNQGNVAMLDTLFAADYALHPGGFAVDQLRINILSLRAAMPDLVATQVILIAQDDWVAAHVVMQGTFTNEFISPNAAPLPPTNAPLQFVTNMIFHFNPQGQVYEQWVTFDNFAYLAQLDILDFEVEPWQGSSEATTLYPLSENEAHHQRTTFVYYEAFNSRDIALLQPTLAESFTGINPFGSLNRDEQIGDLNSLFGAFPDLGVRVDGMIVDGMYVAVLYNLHGTFTNEFIFADVQPFAPTNQTLDLIRIDFLRFNQQGQIEQTIEVYDTFDFMLQLGLFVQE
jgi:predicted ester cyclase